MGEDIGRRGRGALSEGVASSTRPRTTWDQEAVPELRGAVYREDGPAVVGALRGRGLEKVLQIAGDGLLVTLPARVSEARQPAATCAALLRERSNPGDEELADELEAAMGSRPATMLRPLAVDLEELSSMLEGDALRGGGWLDLESGETWPSGTEEVWGEEFGDEEDLNEARSERWLWVECLGSGDGYQRHGGLHRKCVRPSPPGHAAGGDRRPRRVPPLQGGAGSLAGRARALASLLRRAEPGARTGLAGR